jgi:hypothetical protein
MIAVILEAYGAFCLFSLIAFLVWAWFAELRPDLDEPEFGLDELEKLGKPASREQCDSDHETGEEGCEDRRLATRSPAKRRYPRLVQSTSLYSRLASIVQRGDSHCRW